MPDPHHAIDRVGLRRDGAAVLEDQRPPTGTYPIAHHRDVGWARAVRAGEEQDVGRSRGHHISQRERVPLKIDEQDRDAAVIDVGVTCLAGILLRIGRHVVLNERLEIHPHSAKGPHDQVRARAHVRRDITIRKRNDDIGGVVTNATLHLEPCARDDRSLERALERLILGRRGARPERPCARGRHTRLWRGARGRHVMVFGTARSQSRTRWRSRQGDGHERVDEQRARDQGEQGLERDRSTAFHRRP